MEETNEKVLAMYDVRGIQNYIFKTEKVKDAIGASAIVENIIEEALEDAVQKMKLKQEMTADLQWYQEDYGPLEYHDHDMDVQVLFIGGGNAYVMYRDRELCVDINKLMSKYILERTYSLQLAVAITEISDNYSNDIKKIRNIMRQTKAKMVMIKPLGSLPVMQAELKTGYPIVEEDEKEGKIGTETKLKRDSARKKQNKETEEEERIFDNLALKKGIDSNIAVVHIDGNSMGLRVRKLTEKKTDYQEAVNTMRKISYNINHSYKKVFEDMKAYFTNFSKGVQEFNIKENEYFIRKILVAGDDITYVCNAKIALATVEYYCKHISLLTMNGGNSEEDIRKYGFSVCAGVAFMGSHFPFSIGYNVAESLCKSAKDRAKEDQNADIFEALENGEKITFYHIGNFVDFHICQNIQSQNFKEMRKREYITHSGERLLRRPYYISIKNEAKLAKNNKQIFAWNQFKEAVKYFQTDEEKLPSSFAKEIRNTYSQGESQINLLKSFLESRNWEMPDGKDSMYFECRDGKVAKWYDALEMLDYYIDLDKIGEDRVNE